MKNRILKKIGASLTALSCLSCASGFFCCPKAYVNTVKSPQQSIQLVQHLMKGDNQGVINTAALIQKKDNNFDVVFNNSSTYASYTLAEPAAGQMYFAVFMDHKTGKNLAMQPLVKGDQVTGETYYRYSTSYTAPSNVDMVDVHIYSQQSNLPAYYPVSSNFVGKLRLFTASNDIYLRQSNTQIQITKYKSDGTAEVPADQTSCYFNRLTPNLFTLYDSQTVGGTSDLLNETNQLVVIEPTADGGGQNMKQEDKVIQLTGFNGYDPNSATVPASTQALPTTASTLMGNLYIPDGLTSFYLKVYEKGAVSSANLIYQYYINLNRS